MFKLSFQNEQFVQFCYLKLTDLIKETKLCCVLVFITIAQLLFIKA